VHRSLKSIKAVAMGAGTVLAILMIPIQLNGQNGQVPHSSGDKTQSTASKPGNKTPQKGSDLPCLANGLNSPGVKSQASPGAIIQPHRVDLTWEASSSPGHWEYKVHRCTPDGPCAPIKSLKDTTYTDLDVHPLQTYCYFITAAAASGPDSSPSNFVQVVIPSP
jgi:hypothetical protein